MPTFDVHMTIHARVREEAGRGVMLPQVERGLDRVANPDREDDGILSFDLSGVHGTRVDARLTVAAPGADAAEDLALDAAKRGLDRVTNYLREDDGLLSFSLAVTGVAPAADAGPEDDRASGMAP